MHLVGCILSVDSYFLLKYSSGCLHALFLNIFSSFDLADEDTALDPAGVEAAESNILEVLRDMWEEQFVPVAQHLLQRLKTHHTDLVPLESPS